MKKYESVFSRNLSPWQQVGIAFGLYLLVILAMYIYSRVAGSPFPKSEVWMYSTSILFFFILMNALFSFAVDKRMLYYRDSVLAIGTYLVITALLGRLISGQDIRDVKTYSWITKVFILVFVLFTALVTLMRKIMEYVIKQDKNESR